MTEITQIIYCIYHNLFREALPEKLVNAKALVAFAVAEQMISDSLAANLGSSSHFPFVSYVPHSKASHMPSHSFTV